MHSEYVYLIQHKASGKFYAGSSYKKNCHPSQFWTTYFTSSKIIKEIILTEGADAFEACYISIRPNNDAREFEAEFLKSVNAARNSDWLNRNNGGAKFKNDGVGRIGKFHSMESKIKIGNATRNPSIETRTKMSIARQNRIISDETRAKLSIKAKNRVTSIETRAKLSAANVAKLQEKVICPHCQTIGGRIMYRWHFDNCKLYNDHTV